LKSVELVLMNKHQISGSGAGLHRYLANFWYYSNTTNEGIHYLKRTKACVWNFTLMVLINRNQFF